MHEWGAGGSLCILAAKFAVLFADAVCAAKAIHAVFRPDKVNCGANDDTDSHLYFHLVPKYQDQDERGGVFQMNPGKVYLSAEEYDAVIQKIKGNLQHAMLFSGSTGRF